MRPLLLAIVLLALTGSSALAGGWAVTSLDPLPDELRADALYQIGYTIRQHGQTPYPNAATSLELTAPDGRTLRFDARAGAQPGQYVAEVRFPAAGGYSWRVNQDWFGVQELGTITVLPAAPAGSPSAAALPAPATASEPALLRLALSLAAGGALVLFGMKLATVARRLVPARGSVR
jgi:hypothetical protein